jgi:prolyl oligopeptidase
MLTWSPQQNVRDGVAYPALYIGCGAHDPRCPAWLSRKLAARLQAATSSDAPILLQVWEDVGHGVGTGRRTQIEQGVAWLGFVMQLLGMAPVGV